MSSLVAKSGTQPSSGTNLTLFDLIPSVSAERRIEPALTA